jgi:hypothetical protein
MLRSRWAGTATRLIDPDNAHSPVTAASARPRCFLTNESAHVLGQFGIFDQRQRLVENRDEPALDRGQHDVEQAGEIGGHRMPGNPVQRDVGDVEVNLTGLDLDRTRIVFVLEPAWSQHETSSPVCAQF